MVGATGTDSNGHARELVTKLIIVGFANCQGETHWQADPPPHKILLVNPAPRPGR